MTDDPGWLVGLAEVAGSNLDHRSKGKANEEHKKTHAAAIWVPRAL